jgi:hypothetical protein
MFTIRSIDVEEVRKRAAEIRGHWSPTERRRRLGLPPDIPARLRSLISEPRAVEWPAKTGL